MTDRRERANLAVLAEWAHATPGDRRAGASTCGSSAARCGSSATDRVTGIVVERNGLTPDGRVRGTGEEETLDVGLVVRAVGYTAEPIPGLRSTPRPARCRASTAASSDADGMPIAGAVRHRLDPPRPDRRDRDEQARRRRGRRLRAGRPAHAPAARSIRTRTSWPRVLAEQEVRPVDWTAWLRLDAEEIRLGQARGAERIKVADLAEHARRGPRRGRRGRPGAELRPARDRRRELAGQRRSTAMTVGTSRSRSANSVDSSARQRDRAGHRAVGDAVLDVRDELVDLVAAGGERRADAQDARHATGGDDLVAAVQAGLPARRCCGGSGRGRSSSAPGRVRGRKDPSQISGECAVEDRRARRGPGSADARGYEKKARCTHVDHRSRTAGV